MVDSTVPVVPPAAQAHATAASQAATASILFASAAAAAQVAATAHAAAASAAGAASNELGVLTGAVTTKFQAAVTFVKAHYLAGLFGVFAILAGAIVGHFM